MSHQINTTIGFSKTNRNLKRALKKYFEPGSNDLSFEAVLPAPKGLYGVQLTVWKSENWPSCRPYTLDGKIRDNKLKFYTINGIPWRLYTALAARLQASLLVTTASTDDMEWTQAEVRPDGVIKPIYSANEDRSQGPVPPHIREILETHKAICGSQDLALAMAHQGQREEKPCVEWAGEGVPF